MLELTLLLAPAEGALVRVLGLIERRGFRLGAVQSRNAARGLQLTVALTAGGRAAEVLLRQVQRLHDVLEASLDAPRPAFALPARPVASPSLPAPTRRGMSFLGIPERISSN